MRINRSVHPTTLGLVLTLAACGDEDSTGASLDGGSTAASAATGDPGGDPTASGTAASSDSASTTAATTAASMTTGEAGEDDGTSTAGPSTTTADGDDTTGASTTDDGTGGPAQERCEAPVDPQPCDQGDDDVFKAIGLGCSDDPAAGIPIQNPVLKAPDKASWRVARRFGTGTDLVDPNRPAWAPREGERFLVIGTGQFAKLDKDGALVEPDDADTSANNNPDGMKQLPGVMKHQVGSNGGAGGTPFLSCDLVHDCSDTLDQQWNLKPDNAANDVFYMAFQLVTPPGTHGYMFDFAYFSEEWPVYVGTDFNDMLVVWSTSETFTGNVTFIENQPLTVTALDPYMAIQVGDPRLAGTGFPGDDEGAGTGWFTAKASAAPGEKFTVAISIFDMGDAVWDTVGILDNFRWDCAGCDPSELDSCGLAPQ